jgi:hypothetical protein
LFSNLRLANLHVTFRRDCDFRIDSHDLVLSDKFSDVQDEFFSLKPVPAQRTSFLQRKSSNASFSTDSEPPKSYTSPKLEQRILSEKSHDLMGHGSTDSQYLRFRNSWHRKSGITPGSLPSPSALAFTPPSVTSSYKHNAGSSLYNGGTPPFSTAIGFQPDFRKDFVESPPFAFNMINVYLYI